jgi:hypothetical protein
MSDFKYKAFCVIDDSGFAVDLARVLSKDVEEVYYVREWKQSGFPALNANRIGANVPGVIKAESVYDLLDKQIDVYIFTDVYRGSDQKHLVSLGKNVFGSRKADELERFRNIGNDVMKSVGLTVPDTELVIGIQALREYSKANKDIYVKINEVRGMAETQYIQDFELCEFWFDDIEKELGSDKDTFHFLVSKKLPSGMSEIGTDPMITAGKIPDIIMAGTEAKDSFYYCVVKPYKDLPEALRIVTDKLLPVFAEYDYRGNFSYEAKVGKDKNPVVLDLTQRIPQPPGALQWYMYRKNLADLFYNIAKGIPLSPDIHKPFGVEIIMKSEIAKKESLPIRIPADIRDHVFLAGYKMRKGHPDIYYTLPQSEVEIEEVGSVEGEGNTLEEAFNNAKAICDRIESMDIRFSLDSFDVIKEELKKLDELDLNFYTLEKPKEPEVIPEPVKKEIPVKKPTRSVSGFLKIINK